MIHLILQYSYLKNLLILLHGVTLVKHGFFTRINMFTAYLELSTVSINIILFWETRHTILNALLNHVYLFIPLNHFSYTDKNNYLLLIRL